MSLGITASVVGGIGAIAGGVISANGAQSAADTQANATQSGIAQQNYQFNTLRGLLQPYVDAGTGALSGYNSAVGQYGSTLGQLNNLTGANGQAAQQSAISGLTSSPLYATAMDLGQQSILANASATGALRNGNTIASLGYLPQQVLSNVMQTQIGNLGTSLSGTQSLVNQYGNLLNLGENAASGTGQAAMNTGSNITNLLGQQGAAQAGGTIGTSNAINSAINGVSSAFGQYANGSNGNYSFSAPAYLNAGGISTNGSTTGLFNTPLFN
ncbi:DNA ejection [Ralstonia phage Firinga]|uniref:DNA transfer protein n=3 Tax=Firingavirus TaxID=2843381 RepID=A0A7G5B9X0_9CAUD|nr:DNA ejection [Ralstonia phage RSK1]YP_010078564.1 DNA ejection [Ralstonia phage Firinga]QMV33093.1 hypothetical protein 18C_00025 [Ralstonia phage Firinga]QMV33313.1 hypothetical protein 12C_00003 [Ralstonia phage Hennie]BAO04679.1 putative DNA transfer protein [Ralstonia phage RSK1]